MSVNKPPLISVVMLNYNGLAYLKRTIPPILKLDYPNYEFIVVDNGSTDRSIEFIKTNKKIKIIENKENLGYSKGKNIGIDKAKGEYIFLLDNDILIKEKDILSNLVKLYDKKTGLVYVPVIDEGETKTTWYGIFYGLYGVKYNKRLEINKITSFKENDMLIGAPDGKNMFFKKHNWRIVGGFDTIQPFNLDDLDIGARFYLYGFKNKIYNRAFSIHLGKNNSSDKRVYRYRFKYLFSGHARSMIKNYKFMNILTRFIPLTGFMALKSIKQSIDRKDLFLPLYFIHSFYLFLIYLPDTLKKRKIIQSQRVIKDDLFLKTKTLNFKR